MKALTRTLLVLFICAIGSGTYTQAQEDDPVSLVIHTTGRIFSEVDQNLEKYEAEPETLQMLVRSDLLPILDVHYSARLILGRAGRGIEKEKIEAFAEAMVNLLVNRYASGLLMFHSSENLMVLPQRGELNEKLTRVRTRVRLPKGGEAPIDYAFHKTAEGWKAFDVIVEGISYVSTYRNQIMPDVRANGIDSVIVRLTKGELDLDE